MAAEITKEHFRWAALEIGQSGENDTLPYDIDAQFVKERSDILSDICLRLFQSVDYKKKKDARSYIDGLTIRSERLLTATGPHGFRITTRIDPFWNLYLNGLGIGIAEANEERRSERAHSYRLGGEMPSFFNRDRSWKAYKESTLADPAMEVDGAIVVQTDISSFYEHIYHHRLENCIEDVFGGGSTVPLQIDRILRKLASGRSFGLPVGGQCARILAEVLMCPIDTALSDASLNWHRYVDDYTLICGSQQDAYRALSILSHALADYGLSLNRTKTTALSAKHYKDYVAAQLGEGEASSVALWELDLRFDPYSDTAQADYEELKESVRGIDVQFLLDLEKDKSQPDTFVLAQVSRTLKFQDARTAAELCATLLEPRNLDSFRASWSKIMRGVYAVRSNDQFAEIFEAIDESLDRVPGEASHLLMPEANALHYLKTIRFARSAVRGRFVRDMYDRAASHTVRRACVDCWRHWADRASFQRLRNQWQNLSPDEQKMLWIAAGRFGDEGRFARLQLQGNSRSSLEPWVRG